MFADTWDREFEDWAKTYLPYSPWFVLKAQCFQESLLKPEAVSHVGAKGLCQFMDFTWKEVAVPLKFPAGTTAFIPELSIQAAAYYDARLRRIWKAKRPENPDRMNLVFASYNAGAGNIIKAQKRCGGPNLYYDIVKCLHLVTGHHSNETKTYVERIRQYEKVLALQESL